jgi:hypothetical protein
MPTKHKKNANPSAAAGVAAREWSAIEGMRVAGVPDERTVRYLEDRFWRQRQFRARLE